MRTENDVELLKAYAEKNDQGAFAEIVSRHGAMVYRVSFRTLVNRHDAEDASQAVFMALIKKSEKLLSEGSLACWLYSVARQTSLFMARSRVRRDQREMAASEIMEGLSHPQSGGKDHEIVLGFLDKELDALSSGQREAIIFRHLDGMSEKEAAAIAGCAPNTLSCRASEGIANLRKRLVRRGCALGVPALVAFLEMDAHAAIPQTLIPSLLAVPELAAAGATAGTATANIINIMEGALKAMVITKIKIAGVGLLVLLLIGSASIMTVKKFLIQQEKPNNPVLEKKQEAKNFRMEVERALAAKDWEKLEAALKEWGRSNHEEAIQWGNMQNMRRSIGGMFMEFVAEGWAEKDPVSAAQWAEKLTNRDELKGSL